ncbi:MAG: hypothetical protein ACRCXQ_02725 [Vagococcus fluvialis]
MTILNQMKSKIENIEKPIEKIEIKKMGFNKKNNPEFSIFFDEINITPSRRKISVSDAAISQYAQILDSLGILMFGKTKQNELEGFYDVSANFKSTICNNYDSEMIKRLISFCLKRNISYSRDLSFSIFLCSLEFYKFDFNNINIQNIIVEKSRGKDAVKVFDPRTEYGRFYLGDCLKRTYNKLLEHTIKNEGLEEFINDLYIIIKNQDKNNDNINVNDTEIADQIEIKNSINALERERGKLKDQIIKNRQDLNLYYSNDKLYSDIITIDNSIDGLAGKVNELEAAHIYNM